LQRTIKPGVTVTRRNLLAGGAATALLTSSQTRAVFAAQDGWTTSHGMSVFGELAEPADFKAFAYVRTDAPKGGVVSQESYGTFNSLNPFILTGDAPDAVEMIYDSLMTQSLDERDAYYPLVAKSVAISPDKRTLRFELRPEARFQDGSKLTAKDVVFSLNTLKSKAAPTIRQALRDMEEVTAEGDYAVVVRLAPNASRDARLIIARQPILSAAYYETHKFEEASLDKPLGSGPYMVGNFEAGRYIAFERVKNYWGRDLPVNVGQNNFDVVRYEYFSDRPVAFEAFKAGTFTVHEEFTAANWATGYDFPAFREKRVVREEIPDANISGIQGWFFNTRRPMFKDRRVRDAIGYAFDFVWTNKNLMYGAYTRTTSFFENSDMKAVGKPDARELALLEPFRGKVPDEVFGEVFVPPVSDGSGQDRALLKQASEILQQAGCVRDGGILKGPDGKPIEIEFLDFSSALERHTQPFIKNLKLLGIDARMRIVDPAQYQRRLEDFDFDVITQRLSMSYSPGEELRALFGSEAAETRGSRNRTGVSDPVVDALIAKALVVNTRDELVVICRALDRVLRSGRYWVPHWYKPTHWIAHWDVFGRPDRSPKFATGIVSTWWWDDARAKKIAFSGRD
jgi:microcin C transport system substrate-binding protein